MTIAGYRPLQSLPRLVNRRTASPSRRTCSRYPSRLISCAQSGPEGTLHARVGMQGGTNPLESALGKGMRQSYRLARPGGNGQIAALRGGQRRDEKFRNVIVGAGSLVAKCGRVVRCPRRRRVPHGQSHIGIRHGCLMRGVDGLCRHHHCGAAEAQLNPRPQAPRPHPSISEDAPIVPSAIRSIVGIG
jgi:hypothetical protein